MATCIVGRCDEQHGLVNGVCHDHLRWREHFTDQELDALLEALSYGAEGTPSPRLADLMTGLSNQIWAVRHGVPR
jgi:hypothetical protein